ncbi:hypothetical protein AGLY_012643 [Aphis glycines]|uniref:Uncharacterized protein n=1 Tax=Aphis glycines TaxID=307491 RepID=A0A6G0T8W8_APHGL|nr:hypothetical protein AGLY_012643 [Aphis glycines]
MSVLSLKLTRNKLPMDIVRNSFRWINIFQKIRRLAIEITEVRVEMEKTIYKSLNYPSKIYLIYIFKGHHGRILLKFQRFGNQQNFPETIFHLFNRRINEHKTNLDFRINSLHWMLSSVLHQPYSFDHIPIDMHNEDMVLCVAFYSNIVHQNYKGSSGQTFCGKIILLWNMKLKIYVVIQKSLPFILFNKIYPECILNFIFFTILVFTKTLHKNKYKKKIIILTDKIYISSLSVSIVARCVYPTGGLSTVAGIGIDCVIPVSISYHKNSGHLCTILCQCPPRDATDCGLCVTTPSRYFISWYVSGRIHVHTELHKIFLKQKFASFPCQYIFYDMTVDLVHPIFTCSSTLTEIQRHVPVAIVKHHKSDKSFCPSHPPSRYIIPAAESIHI